MEYDFFHHYYIKWELKFQIMELYNSTIYCRIPLFQVIPYSGILCCRERKRGNDGNLMEFENDIF